MLSKKTKYGLKALTYIARLSQGELVSITTIVKEEQIPRKFLEQILLELKKAGILQSKKGKGGGYFLDKAPHTISMASVIRILEGPIAMLPCVSLNFYSPCEDCCDEKKCTVNRLMLEVRDQTLGVLENKFLSDFI